jgi:hypothetical protein
MAGPIESKVTVGALAATITTGIVTFILSAYPSIPENISDLGTAVILAAVTGGLTFGAGFWAKHTHRTDPDALASSKGRHTTS